MSIEGSSSIRTELRTTWSFYMGSIPICWCLTHFSKESAYSNFIFDVAICCDLLSDCIFKVNPLL
jgi:hypothetical protein